jgi:hypothetical protein
MPSNVCHTILDILMHVVPFLHRVCRISNPVGFQISNQQTNPVGYQILLAFWSQISRPIHIISKLECHDNAFIIVLTHLEYNSPKIYIIKVYTYIILLSFYTNDKPHTSHVYIHTNIHNHFTPWIIINNIIWINNID